MGEGGATEDNPRARRYVESESPYGPWENAVKVLTHDNYTFYNPVIHMEVRAPRSPVLLFEGTYTASFANRPPKTPRWDYTQVLYRLDLDDPRLPGKPVKFLMQLATCKENCGILCA